MGLEACPEGRGRTHAVRTGGIGAMTGNQSLTEQVVQDHDGPPSDEKEKPSGFSKRRLRESRNERGFPTHQTVGRANRFAKKLLLWIIRKATGMPDARTHPQLETQNHFP